MLILALLECGQSGNFSIKYRNPESYRKLIMNKTITS